MLLNYDSPVQVSIRQTKDGKSSVTCDVLGASFWLPRDAAPLDLKEGVYKGCQFEVALRSLRVDTGARSVFAVVRLVSVK